VVSGLRLLFNDLIHFEIEMWNAVDARLKAEVDLSLTHFAPMDVIGRVPNCRVHDIAAELRIPSDNTGKLVSHIEASGYCRREPHPGDLRSSILTLTPEGQHVLAKAGRALDEELQHWLGPASDRLADPAADLAFASRHPRSAAGYAGVGGVDVTRAGLLDREAEQAAIDGLLRSVRGGFSATLVIRGSTGVGKTALLGYAASSAPDMRVCSVTGIETEIGLAFAALHQLLVPVLAGMGELPDPQRHALHVAFGMEAGPPVDRFLVGLASLTLLARAAEEQPVLCLIDDEQWLDAESARVLAFVARRLYADRVGMVIAVKEPAPADAFEQLPEISVGGLPAEEAGQLLRSVAKAPIHDQVIGRILTETEGNPLALVQVGPEFTAEELAGRSELPEPMPLGRRLTDRFRRQVAELDPITQTFLLLAASEAGGDRSVLWGAAREGGIDADTAAAEAEAAGLIELLADSVRFRYPLIRSAVYYGASDRDRRRVQLLLSAACDAVRYPHWRAWHRGAAATGPDEDVAAELEQAANLAQARGGYTGRVALLRRSVQLTADSSQRARRELALADAELRSGYPDVAQDLVDAALPDLSDPGPRALGEQLRGEILFAQGRVSDSANVLAGAARLLSPDHAAAREAMAAAMKAAIWAGSADTREMSAAAAAIQRPAEPEARVCDQLLEGFAARFTAGYAAAIEPFRGAITALRSQDPEQVTELRWHEMAVMAAGSIWDANGVMDITDRFLRAARAQGALAVLPVALALRATADCSVGRLSEAADRWAEMREIIAASRSATVVGVDSLSEGAVLVHTGRIAEARAVAAARIRESASRGQGGVADVGKAIAAMADVWAGDYDAAVGAAAAVVQDDIPFVAEVTLPELIEAAARSCQRSEAVSAFHILSERALAAGTSEALGIRSRCAALLDEGDAAEASYQQAIGHLGRGRAVVELARAHLQYGEWLRRGKRKRDARKELRAAYDMLEAMGAKGLAARAAAELRATGERARPRTSVPTADLTSQEARVAGLAAEGDTNNQIAAQLFISPHTVEYHMAKVFAKLGVTSRAQLARRMLASPEPLEH
jgi:DNA-binding CsgD family transcriptional regulator/DNA-binding MarR family transcriptional regulator